MIRFCDVREVSLIPQISREILPRVRVYLIFPLSGRNYTVLVCTRFRTLAAPSGNEYRVKKKEREKNYIILLLLGAHARVGSSNREAGSWR